jgi:NADH-quinone oxidoreductase subunit G
MRALESAGVVALTPFVGKGLQQVADVLLPVAAFGESAGSLINVEGQLQQFNGATAPPGEARPAWKVFRVLGNLLDLDGFEQDSVADVVDAGLTKRLESVTTLPFADTGWRAGERLFTTDGCQRTGEVAPCSIDGLVRRAPSLQASADGWDGHVAISPAQAQTLLVGDGDRLTLTGSDGEVTLPLRIDPALAERSIALPGGVAESVAVGGLLSPLTLKKA